MSHIVDYDHFIPPVPVNPDFPDKYCQVLVESMDYLKNVLEENKDKKFMSFDLETSDLDPTAGFIVGYSISFDGITGYYIPVRHATGNCFGEKSLALIHSFMQNLTRVFVANVRFDYRYMEFNDYYMGDIPYFDIIVGIFLADSNKPMPSLKWAEKHFLGWDRKNFEETLGDNYNFYYLDPKDAYFYAATDAISTFALAHIAIKYYKEAGLAGKLDNEFLYPLMRFENEPIRMDIDWLQKMYQEQVERLKQLEQSIYTQFGYSFKISSGKQLSDALQRLGLDTGKYVKSGYMKTDIQTLEDLEGRTKHPVLKTLVEYKKLNKATGSYTETLLKYAQEKDGRLRFAYHNTRVPTCRLACGSDGKNTFFAKINEQSIPKPHPTMWYVHPYHEGDEVPEGDEVILNWRFSLTDKNTDKWMEGFDPKDNIRRAFLPEEGCYWVSVDYSAQELRCIANYSKDPTWVSVFNHGGDLHKNMAISMWGEENYDKEKRKRAKVLNFGMAYGMSGYSLAEKFHITVDEGNDIVDKFWKAVPSIKAFQHRCVAKAKKEGTIYNYFGRPRRVRKWLKSADRKQVAFGIRTVNNTVIQSVGADILKISIINLWKKMYNNPEYKGHVRFLSTIHDEINSSMSYEKIDELVKLKTSTMTRKFPNWPVQFEVGLEIGNSWGATFAFKIEDGVIMPDWEDVPEEEPHVEEEIVEEEVVEEDEDFNFNIEL